MVVVDIEQDLHDEARELHCDRVRLAGTGVIANAACMVAGVRLMDLSSPLVLAADQCRCADVVEEVEEEEAVMEGRDTLAEELVLSWGGEPPDGRTEATRGGGGCRRGCQAAAVVRRVLDAVGMAKQQVVEGAVERVQKGSASVQALADLTDGDVCPAVVPPS